MHSLSFPAPILCGWGRNGSSTKSSRIPRNSLEKRGAPTLPFTGFFATLSESLLALPKCPPWASKPKALLKKSKARRIDFGVCAPHPSWTFHSTYSSRQRRLKTDLSLGLSLSSSFNQSTNPFISLAYLRPVDARLGDVCKENLSSFTPPSGLVTNSRRSISTPSNRRKPKNCSANSWNFFKSCTSFSATDLGWMRVLDEITGISLTGVNPSLGGGALFLKVSSPSGASFFSASLAEGSCECFGGLAGFEKPETGGISLFSLAALWGVNSPFWPPWDSAHGGNELPTPKASVLVDFLDRDPPSSESPPIEVATLFSSSRSLERGPGLSAFLFAGLQIFPCLSTQTNFNPPFDPNGKSASFPFRTMSMTCSGDTPTSKRLAISSRADQAPAEVTPLVSPNPARTSLFTPSGGRLSSSESEGFWYLLLLSDLEDFLPALLSDRSRRRSLLSLLLFGTAFLFHSSNLLLPLGGPEAGSVQIGPPPPRPFSSIRWVGEKDKWNGWLWAKMAPIDNRLLAIHHSITRDTFGVYLVYIISPWRMCRFADSLFFLVFKLKTRKTVATCDNLLAWVGGWIPIGSPKMKGKMKGKGMTTNN